MTPSANVSAVQQSNHFHCNNYSQQPPPITCTSKVDDEIPKTDDVEPPLQSECEDQPVKDVCKINPHSLENSLSSPSKENVCRSESPPSLVFSAESLNGDDNQCEDFDEFQQNTDDVECFPSLKLDSISDTKSQSSDLDEAAHLAECEIDDSETINTRHCSSNVDVECNKNDGVTRSSNADELNVTNVDDSFDDFVEYESNGENVDAAERCDQSIVAKLSHDEFIQSKGSTDENAFAADFSQFEIYSKDTITEPDPPNTTTEQHKSGFASSLDQQPTEKPSTVTDTMDDFNDMDDDDEFGEFSDFSQSQTFTSPLTTNVEELSAKIRPLLNSLFPSSDSETEDSNYDALDLTNDTTRIIRDFENSKALDHQWTSSVGKSSLVTALGIDSRNIVSRTYKLVPK